VLSKIECACISVRDTLSISLLKLQPIRARIFWWVVRACVNRKMPPVQQNNDVVPCGAFLLLNQKEVNHISYLSSLVKVVFR
jgi:hypothetical protein